MWVGDADGAVGAVVGAALGVGDTDGTGSPSPRNDVPGANRHIVILQVSRVYLSPLEARPSITRRCNKMNMRSTGAMASKLAAMTTG